MSRFESRTTPIAGLHELVRKPLADSRGFLERMYCADDLKPLLGERQIVQVNRTLTRLQGTIRGLHFQHPPHAETKLISCLRGEVFDVAVDLRAGSPTFLQWHGTVLSQSNQTSLVIPEGFAHGFQTLSADCEMLYVHTAAYEPTSEGSLQAQDPCLAILWPLPVADMSERDQNHPMLDAHYIGITL